MDPVAVLLVVLALAIGGAVGWYLGSRGAVEAREERDRREIDFKSAIADLARAEERAAEVPQLRVALADMRTERDELKIELAEVRTRREAAEEAIEARVRDLIENKELMAGQFREVAGQLLGEAQSTFLTRANERFSEEGKSNEARLKALLNPVETTLKRYEQGLREVEKERADSYGALREAVAEVKSSLGETRSETAKLVNALRAAPKARGRWGEQQFRNLIELAGLDAHVDFGAEVSVATEDGQLRPDFIIRLPGDQQLIVDVKCVLDSYMTAAEATSNEERQAAMLAHARAVRSHADALSKKAYWAQFEKAPDFVIMYIPGDNFLSGALEIDMELWERAARNRVIIAGPSAFLPLARTVASMWRQQKVTEDAKEIARLGKEMYERLATAATHLRRVGNGLNSAVDNYNKFVSSFDGRVLVTARRFQALNVDTGNASLDPVEPVDALSRAPMLDALPAPNEGSAEAESQAKAAE